MTIVSSETKADKKKQKDNTRYVTHRFTDHTGKVTKHGPKRVDGDWTETEYAIDRNSSTAFVEDILASQEIQAALSRADRGLNPDKVPSDQQTQPEFDRRVLGRMMLIDSAHIFHNAYVMFLTVNARGGNNANQISTYLGISTANYNRIAERFDSVNLSADFLADERLQIWDELPDEFL